MNPIKSVKNLSLFERCLWAFSVVTIVLSGIFGKSEPMQIAASVVGADIRFKGRRVRSSADDSVFRHVRSDFVCVCILRRDADLSVYDRTDSSVGGCDMAAPPV